MEDPNVSPPIASCEDGGGGDDSAGDSPLPQDPNSLSGSAHGDRQHEVPPYSAGGGGGRDDGSAGDSSLPQDANSPKGTAHGGHKDEVPLFAEVGDDDASAGGSSLPQDPNSPRGSVAGDHRDEVALSAVAQGGGEASGKLGNEVCCDAEFGFQRPDFGKEPLAGTVQLCDRHLFLCHKDLQAWPSTVKAAEINRLHRLLSSAIEARKADMKKMAHVTLCEGDGTESSNGDVLIFPEMVRYRQLTHSDVDMFVEEVLVKEVEWYQGVFEKLTGSYVFVCDHGSRDKKCGVCGPALLKRFKEEIIEQGLQGHVSVHLCSCVDGHKYAGNVIIFSPRVNGAVTGHGYGCVSPDDVPLLIDQHIGKGQVGSPLWRGQMGLPEVEEKKAQELPLQLNWETEGERSAKGCCKMEGVNESIQVNGSLSGTELTGEGTGEYGTKKTEEKNSNENEATSSRHSSTRLPTLVGRWEWEDICAALAVAAALVSLAIASGPLKRVR